MKTTLLLTFILCANVVSAQWTRIGNSPNQAQKIYFYNAQTAYALKHDTIFRSTDGGATWNALPASFPQYTSMNDIRFITPDTGFVYITEGLSFAYPVSIYMTINGGQNWNKIIGPYDGSDIAFHLAGKNDWYFHVTSQWLSPPSDSILHTVNGGNSWTRTGNASTVQYNQAINNLVVYRDSTTTAQTDLFYKSTDGGASWNLLLTDNTASAGIVDYQFVNSNNGYVLVYQYNATDNIDSKIYKTTNAGQNWTNYDLPAAITAPQYMHFTDVNTGYITSYSSPLNQVYKTMDGGQTWNLDFTGNTQEYFSGNTGIDEYFGKLYILGHTVITNNVSTSVKDPENNELAFSLFPNPSTGQLCIKQKISNKDHEFVIVDLTGKEVYAFSTGQSLVQNIDVSFLSSGLYLFKQKDTSQSVLFIKE